MEQALHFLCAWVHKEIKTLTKLHNQYMIRTKQVNEKILRGWVKRQSRHSLPAVKVRDP